MPENINQPLTTPTPLTNGSVFTAQPNATATPAGSGGVDQNAELMAIIAGLSQNQPTQNQGLVAKLLQAAAQGIGTATSGNPGGALLQQIQQIQAQRQMERERQDKINMIAAQFKLNDLSNRIAEEREIRKEQRINQLEIAKEERGRKYETQREATAFDRQRQIEDIKQSYAMESSQFNRESAIQLEKLRSSNDITEKRMGEYWSMAYPLIFSGAVPDKDVDRLSKKAEQGIPFDAEDTKILAKANKQLRDEKYRQERALRALAHPGGGGDSLQSKVWQFSLQKALNDQMAVGENGKVYDLVPNKFTGVLEIPGGIKIARILDIGEKMNYNLEKLGPVLGKGPAMTQVTGPAQAVTEQLVDSRIQADIKAGKTRDEIAAKLVNTFGSTPDAQDRIQQALNRNGLTQPAPESNKPGVVSSTIDLFNPFAAVRRENEQEKKEGKKPGVLSNIIDAYKKKTPEENKKALEEYRKRTNQ